MRHLALVLNAFAAAVLGAQSAPLDTLRGHTNVAYAAVFTPDGRKIISASEDYTLKVWDVGTGRLLDTWQGHTGEVLAAAITPDGRKAVSGGEDMTLKVWDIESGQVLATLRGHEDEVRTISLSPDGGTAVTTSFEGVVKLWDLEAYKEISTLQEGRFAHALDAVFSPDGGKILTGQWDRTLRLYEVRTGKILATWRGHRAPVVSIAFSPDGTKALSGSRDTHVRLWDVHTGETLGIWRGHKSYAYTVAFSPDGRTAVSGGADHHVKIWDVATGKDLGTWKGHHGGIRTVAFSPDGSLVASASEDYSVMLWDVTGRRAPRTSPPPQRFSMPQGFDDPEVRLGWLLFSDNRLSGDNSRSCTVCHNPNLAYTDGLPLSKGSPETLYFRNAPTLLNVAAQKHLYWDGRFPAEDLPSLIRDHISEAHFMNADGRLLVEKLRQAPGYVEAFRAAYNSEPSYAGILRALTAFIRSLKSPEPEGREPLSPTAQRGRELFNGIGGCAQCHSGPTLSDGEFHNRSVPENPAIFDDPLRQISFRRFFKLLGVKDYLSLRSDPGLFGVTQEPSDQGKFRTPTLLEVSRTAPYMHNGIFSTLEETVAFENPRLNKSQVSDITAYLHGLSGKTEKLPIPALPPYALRPASVREEPVPIHTEPEDFSIVPLGPLPEVPVPEDNPPTPAKVKLGERLFFDQRISGNGDTFCGACHEPAMGWGDNSELSQGYSGNPHWRNTQTLLNSAYFSRLDWDGAKESLEEQARTAILSGISGNGDPVMIEERLAQSPEYIARFKESFGVDRPHFEGVLQAIASFVRAVPLSRNVPFDAYTRGDKTAISAEAIRGLRLFEGKARCIQCHHGPLVSDQRFHATGVPRPETFDEVPLRQVAIRYEHILHGVPEEVFRRADSDPGLYLTTLRQEDIGRFRTPSLRELKFTAPYMHNGVFMNLAEVLDFYEKGGGPAKNKDPLLRPLNLTAGDKKDLLAFLESLSGEEIILPYPQLPGYGTPEDGP